MLANYLQAMKDAAEGNQFWACANAILGEVFKLPDAEIENLLLHYQFQSGTDWEDEGDAVWLTTEGTAHIVKALNIPESKLNAFLTALYSLS